MTRTSTAGCGNANPIAGMEAGDCLWSRTVLYVKHETSTARQVGHDVSTNIEQAFHKHIINIRHFKTLHSWLMTKKQLNA